MLRRVGVPLLATVLAATLVAPGAAATHAFPATIALPNGFQPEGIAIGPGPVAYLGSLADGSIYRADLVTGKQSPEPAGSHIVLEPDETIASGVHIVKATMRGT